MHQRQADMEYKFDSTDDTPPFPKNALIEVTNACNHECVFCTNPRMERQKGFLPLELFQTFVREAVPLGLQELGLYSTGEPLIAKHLVEYIRIAKQENVNYVYITTNGSLASLERVVPLLEAGLDSLKFSINAGTRESYKFIHGKDDFDRVFYNLQSISNYRKTASRKFRLFASCTVTKFTEHEMDSLRDRLLPLVDEVIFFGVNAQQGQSTQQFEQLRASFSEIGPVHGNACHMLWNWICLTAEGYLSLCCADYENALVYAKVGTENLQTLWHNTTIRKMRSQHHAGKLEGTLCHNCIHGKDTSIHPICDIANPKEKMLHSQNPSGVDSVNKRIQQLNDHYELVQLQRKTSL